MNRLVIALMLIAAFAFTANATPPPAHGGYLAGWGMNPTNWETATGSFSEWGIYDGTPSGGAGWVVGYDGNMDPIYIDYDPITLELWIEMYCLQTYHYTSYQWHRRGDGVPIGSAETITFIVEGLCQSNNGQYVQLMQGAEPLDMLYFRHNVLNGSSPGGCDIPITWEGQWGTGIVYGSSVVEPWTTLTPDPDLTMLIPDPCDHWFQFRGEFTIPYHHPDGYYSLEMAGCPAPVL